MSEFFGTIYCWFESLFSQDMAEYLWGYNCTTQDYSNPNLFNQIGLTTLIVSLFFVWAYYYWINHPRFNGWKSWLLVLVTASVINLFIAYGWTASDFLSGTIGDCLMFTRDEEGNIIAQLIHESDCVMFGVANSIVSALFFTVFSFISKWKSRNCKHSPCL
jgi:hypothetical protein